MKTIDGKYVLGLLALVIAIVQPAALLAQEVNSPGELSLQPQALEATGIYDLKSMDPGLTGSGVKYAVICRSLTYINDMPQNDYRPAISHNCFQSNQFVFHQDDKPWGVSPHATALCSILFGEDPQAYNPQAGRFYYLGVVPRANADIYELWHFLKNNVYYHLAPDADILTAAFGTQFPEWWIDGIESLAEQYGTIIVAGIGNGTNAADPVLYPAAGSNAIGVGVVDSINAGDLLNQLANFSLAFPDHSSTGPTSDGRCKPDIVAPGNCLVADIYEPNKYQPTGNWSSFATPVVAGAVGLLVQKAKEQPDLSMAVSPYGGNCVIKAILLNSATKLPFWHKGTLGTDDDHIAPLDYIQGAGMLNALGAYYTLIAGRQKPGPVANVGWDLNQLDNKIITSNVYQFTIDEPKDKYITATLSWNRHFERVYPFKAQPERNSDLRLEVWAVSPEKTYMLDYSDSLVDNVEHIYCPADPNCTSYEIVLSIDNLVNQNPENVQRYGLAWSVGPKPDRSSRYWYDLNADGVVDMADLTSAVMNRVNSLKPSDDYIFGDVDLDGQITPEDLAKFLQNIDVEKSDSSPLADTSAVSQEPSLVSSDN